MLPRSLLRLSRPLIVQPRPLRHHFHTTQRSHDTPTSLHNILAGGAAPAVQVKTVTPEGIELEDGLIIPSACLFVNGKTFLWDVPIDGWKEELFEVFEVVVPKPEILLLGTGKTLVPPPPSVRQYLSKIGIQIDIMNTWNACSTYNLLAEEGRRVAAALLPITPSTWTKIQAS